VESILLHFIILQTKITTDDQTHVKYCFIFLSRLDSVLF